MRKFKKVLAIVMATMFVLAMGMIYASAAMEVNLLRSGRSSSYQTAEYSLYTDFYPDTDTGQVTSTISCDTGHTVYSESSGMIAYNDDPDTFFAQTSLVLPPSNSYISYAIQYLPSSIIDDVYYIEGYHYFEYDGFEIYPQGGNTTRLYNNGNF